MLALQFQERRVPVQTAFCERLELGQQRMRAGLSGVERLPHEVRDRVDLLFQGSFIGLCSFSVHLNNKYYESINREPLSTRTFPAKYYSPFESTSISEPKPFLQNLWKAYICKGLVFCSGND